ncbi:MAG: hypothetical protein IT559_05270 [Alphaproteobacteria bacterium]|nr:hypothetical protein [Alphaproteobacteria bacterium]
MLSATETARVKKFVAGMDEKTAQAMSRLFELTKPGCSEAAYELMAIAHDQNMCASDRVISNFATHGLINRSGSMPRPVASAIRKAVAEHYLAMRAFVHPVLKPDLLDFDLV